MLIFVVAFSSIFVLSKSSNRWKFEQTTSTIYNITDWLTIFQKHLIIDIFAREIGFKSNDSTHLVIFDRKNYRSFIGIARLLLLPSPENVSIHIVNQHQTIKTFIAVICFMSNFINRTPRRNGRNVVFR